MNPISLIPGPYKILAAVIAFVAFSIGLLWTGHHYGAQGVQAKWARETAERKESENKAVFERIRNNERVAEQQEIDRQKLKKGHADEITRLRSTYAAADRLRINATVCNGFAGTTKTESTSGGDGGTATSGLLPETYSGNLKQLMLEADTIVAGCRVAREFILSNGMAP